MNLALTIATGTPHWGNMALNWAISVKSNLDPHNRARIKLGLIYTPSAIVGIEALIDQFFDYKYEVPSSDVSGQSSSDAFHLKTQLFDIVQGIIIAYCKLPTTNCSILYMDADTIMLPGHNLADWFKKHNVSGLQGIPFTCYCNDVYEYFEDEALPGGAAPPLGGHSDEALAEMEQGVSAADEQQQVAGGSAQPVDPSTEALAQVERKRHRLRADYTFWCDPEEARKYWFPNSVSPLSRGGELAPAHEQGVLSSDGNQFAVSSEKEDNPNNSTEAYITAPFLDEPNGREVCNVLVKLWLNSVLYKLWYKIPTEDIDEEKIDEVTTICFTRIIRQLIKAADVSGPSSVVPAFLPQINSSFLFFQLTPDVKRIFDAAKLVWADNTFPYQKYKGAKPDELCFNIALAINGIMPHQVPYRPIFFQCFSESWAIEYILHHYKAIGFAGTVQNPQYLINFYNEITQHYRNYMGIVPMFTIKQHQRITQDTNPIILQPLLKKTIHRTGELPNSDGGIFNPDALQINGTKYLILRKERNLDAYRNYAHSTGIPHLIVTPSNIPIRIDVAKLEDICPGTITPQQLVEYWNNAGAIWFPGTDNKKMSSNYNIVTSSHSDFELQLTGYNPLHRLEDFRLFTISGSKPPLGGLGVGGSAQPVLFCNHKLILDSDFRHRNMKTCLAYIEGDKLINIGIPNLPISLRDTDINWTFFAEPLPGGAVPPLGGKSGEALAEADKGVRANGIRIFCIYQLSPFMLFYADSTDNYQTWKEFCHPEPIEGQAGHISKPPLGGLGVLNWFHPGQYICNSTNPILIPSELLCPPEPIEGQAGQVSKPPLGGLGVDYYLTFFHTKESGIYYQGAALINQQTKQIQYYTRNSILIKHPSMSEGLHPGIIYVSGAEFIPDSFSSQSKISNQKSAILRVYFGEADSNACYHDYDARELIQAIVNNHKHIA